MGGEGDVEERGVVWGKEREDMVVNECVLLVHTCGAAWIKVCVIALCGFGRCVLLSASVGYSASEGDGGRRFLEQWSE